MEDWTRITRQRGRLTKIAPKPVIPPPLPLSQPSSNVVHQESLLAAPIEPHSRPISSLRARPLRGKPAAKPQPSTKPSIKPAAKPQPVTRSQVVDATPKKLRLSRHDLTRYRDGSFPRVTEVIWRAGSRLDADVLKAFPNLQILDCNDEGIDDIEAVAVCSKLRILRCSDNGIVVIGALAACPELIEIDCSNNELVTLIGLGACTKLKKIKCQRNNLTSLEGLENSKELTYIDCSNNKIGSLEPLQGCTQLYLIDCCHNELRTLSGLDSCITLDRVICHHNLLVNIRALAGCIGIDSIDCRHNRLGDMVGLESKIKLKTVFAQYNKIGLLGGLAGCIALRELRVEHNKIRSTRDLGDCLSLEKLVISKNYLSDLELGLMPRLKEVHCEKNTIQVLSGLVNCPVLKHLRCDNNSLVSVAHLSNCTQLQTLYCRDNLLVSLKGLGGLQYLVDVDCTKNNLETLEGIEGCKNLTSLNCKYNCITNLEHVVRLRNLRSFKYKHNPLGQQSPQVQHYIHMVEERRRGRSTFYYTDNENVMSTAVKDSVFKSIQNLMRDSTPVFTMRLVEESGLNYDTVRRIKDSCSDTSIHSELLVSYKQLFSYVWQRVCASEHKIELLKILEQQVNEGATRCLIGRLTRALATLVGFYDDIHIAIAPSSQIHAIVQVTKAQVKPYNAMAHRALVQERLHEINYADEEIRPWLDAIYDPEEQE